MSTRAIATSPDRPTERVRLTSEEKSERQKEVEAYLSTVQMRDWEIDMIDSDRELPRPLEDIIDVLSRAAKSKLAAETLDKYNKKKLLRSRRPKGKSNG